MRIAALVLAFALLPALTYAAGPEKRKAGDPASWHYQFVERKNGREYRKSVSGLSPVRAKCIVDAANRFGVPVSMILTVLDVEGGEVGVAAGNRNKTWDLGPMQINTCHLPELSPYGITSDDLIRNGCLNIQVGAYLLKGHLVNTRGKRLEAVARYHSLREPHKGRYRKKAERAYMSLKKNPGRHIDRVLAKANAPFPKIAAWR